MLKIIKKVLLSAVLLLCMLLPPLQAVNVFSSAAKGEGAGQTAKIAYTTPAKQESGTLLPAVKTDLVPDETAAADELHIGNNNKEKSPQLFDGPAQPVPETEENGQASEPADVDWDNEEPDYDDCDGDEEPDYDENDDADIEPDCGLEEETEELGEDIPDYVAPSTEPEEWWPDEPDITEPEETGEDEPVPEPPVTEEPEPQFVYYKGYFRVQDNRYYRVSLSRELQEHCFNMSQKYGVPYEIIMGIMGIETGWNADIGIVVHSGVRYVGLGCLSEIYCASFFAKKGIDIYTPEGNIEAICYTFSEKLNEFDGNVTYALMAYNMGSGGARSAIAEGTYSTSYSRNAIKVADNLLTEAEYDAIP